MLLSWKRLTHAVKMTNPWWEYHEDTFTMPNGKTGTYHFMHTTGSVVVIPMTDDGRVVCTRQYRYLADRISLELVGGGIESGQTAEEAARNELAEETGFAADSLEKIGEIMPLPGLVKETEYVFLASGLRDVPAHPDVTEEFETVLLTPEELDTAIGGEFFNGWSIAAWALARPRILREFGQRTNV